MCFKLKKESVICISLIAAFCFSKVKVLHQKKEPLKFYFNRG